MALTSILTDQLTDLGQLATQDIQHRRPLDSTALFQNSVIHPALDLKENGRLGIGVVGVESQPEFEAILVAVDGAPIDPKIVGVEVEVVDRVG